jgi:hypothetical protein
MCVKLYFCVIRYRNTTRQVAVLLHTSAKFDEKNWRNKKIKFMSLQAFLFSRIYEHMYSAAGHREFVTQIELFLKNFSSGKKHKAV